MSQHQPPLGRNAMTAALGVSIEVSEALIGSNAAVITDGKLKVSPAVWALLQGATIAEVQHLFENLPVLDFGSSANLLRPAFPLIYCDSFISFDEKRAR